MLSTKWVGQAWESEGSKLNAVRLTVDPILTRTNNLKREDYLQVKGISHNTVLLGNRHTPQDSVPVTNRWGLEP